MVKPYRVRPAILNLLKDLDHRESENYRIAGLTPISPDQVYLPGVRGLRSGFFFNCRIPVLIGVGLYLWIIHSLSAVVSGEGLCALSFSMACLKHWPASSFSRLRVLAPASFEPPLLDNHRPNNLQVPTGKERSRPFWRPTFRVCKTNV